MYLYAFDNSTLGCGGNVLLCTVAVLDGRRQRPNDATRDVTCIVHGIVLSVIEHRSELRVASRMPHSVCDAIASPIQANRHLPTLETICRLTACVSS